MLDLLIKNARICDGTGGPSFMGDLGVQDGIIRSVGEANGHTAARVLDADGLVLAPGFVDPHTHYDAQIAWDPMVTCSPWHGVTTVVMGNCGVGVAAKTPRYAYDLPCNGRRLVSESEGIKATFVAGVQLYDDGKHTGAMPGRILRSHE
jgi:N-acyl-D-aspartate/D-glutamate deacylase